MADDYAWDKESHCSKKAADILESDLPNPNIDGMEEIQIRSTWNYYG